MHTLLKKIKDLNPKLKLRQIEGVFYILGTAKVLTNNDLVRLTGLPKETVKSLKIALSHYLEQSTEDRIVLKNEFCTQFSEARPFDWSINVSFDTSVSTELAVLRETYFKFPANRDYDQFYATAETTIKKAQLLNKLGLLSGQKVALLGDDDLVSLGIQLIVKDKYPLVVFEIDTLLAESLVTYKEEKSLPINVVKADLRNNFDTRILGKYDVVVADPPYTKLGIALFLNRALELLLPVRGTDEDKYIILFYGNSYKTPEKTLKIQELFVQMGLIVENKIDNFAHYMGAESIGSSSSVYVLRVTEKSILRPDLNSSDRIYTFDDQKEEKFPFVDHVVFKLHKVGGEILTSRRTLSSLLGRFCTQHRLKVKSTEITEFKGGGMTITYILYNSNLVVHTWPEYNALHLDLITCSPIYKKDLCLDTLSALFKTKSLELKFVE